MGGCTLSSSEDSSEDEEPSDDDDDDDEDDAEDDADDDEEDDAEEDEEDEAEDDNTGNDEGNLGGEGGAADEEAEVLDEDAIAERFLFTIRFSTVAGRTSIAFPCCSVRARRWNKCSSASVSPGRASTLCGMRGMD